MDTQLLLNRAAVSVSKIRANKKNASTQLNKLLEVLSSKPGSEGILAVQEHLVYQAGVRDLLPKEFCKCVYEDLLEIRKSSDRDPAKEARQYLTHIKRLFKGVEDLESLKIQREETAFDDLARQVFKKASN